MHGLGISEGDRVSTLAWNTQEHLKAYFAVPGAGAVLHTLNMRLSADQLEFIGNWAEDRVILVDESLVPLLGGLLPKLPTVKHVVVITQGVLPDLGGVGVVRYAELVAGGDPAFVWPRLAERRFPRSSMTCCWRPNAAARTCRACGWCSVAERRCRKRCTRRSATATGCGWNRCGA